MARKTVTMGRNPRRKLSSFGSDFPSVETEEGSGRALAKKPPSVKTGEPSGGPLAKRGSTEVSKEGRPSIDVDGRQKRLTGEKVVEGKTIYSNKQALPAPEKPTISQAPKPKNRFVTQGLAGLAGAGAGYLARKGLNVFGPSDDSTGTIASINKARPTEERLKMKGDLPVAIESKKPASATPSAPASKPSTPTPKASAPAPKPKAKPASAKSKSSAEYDDWLADLRGSAARMKAETSRAAEKTGAMKEKASAFSQSFKKGGSVKSRGDGIAQRGRTKGRFV